jgi:hypothetical protein
MHFSAVFLTDLNMSSVYSCISGARHMCVIDQSSIGDHIRKASGSYRSGSTVQGLTTGMIRVAISTAS